MRLCGDKKFHLWVMLKSLLESFYHDDKPNHVCFYCQYSCPVKNILWNLSVLKVPIKYEHV